MKQVVRIARKEEDGVKLRGAGGAVTAVQQALAFFKKSFRFRSASFSRVALVLKP